MSQHRLRTLLAATLIACPAFAAVQFSAGELILDNGIIKRVVRQDPAAGAWSTTSLEHKVGGNYLNKQNTEFAFSLDGLAITGRAGWTVAGWRPENDEGTITLRGHGLRLDITYAAYPGIAVIRKRIAFTNEGPKERRLESIDVESLTLGWSVEKGQVLSQYGRSRSYSPYSGNWDDAVVVAHATQTSRGLAIGNEAPGVLKRTAVFLSRYRIEAGLTHAGDPYPARKWLKPGETWQAPAVFLVAYAQTHDPTSAWHNDLSTFVRRHLRARLFDHPQLPTAIYDTWIPFYEKIDATIVNSLSAAATEAGFDTFAYDYGWASNQGDWNPDPIKFPRGMALPSNLRAGAWMSIASTDLVSDVYKTHPEWIALDKDGKPANLHSTAAFMRTACLGTGWYGHIRERIFHTIRALDLKYLKLDFASIVSAYIHEPERAGCNARNHLGHRDREESILTAYERMQSLLDEIHTAFPAVYLDITFEVWGKLQLIDYALLRHAHGAWMSNISEAPPSGSLQARQLAWTRSAAIPASSMIIGNLRVTDPLPELSFASSLAGLPAMLGDLSKLDPSARSQLRRWTDWLRGCQQRHSVLSYRQDLDGFGEPSSGHWDGFARINTDTKSGGLVAVFREQAAESKRRIFVRGLDPAATYEIRRAPTGTLATRASGSDCRLRGFDVELPQETGFAIFEITRTP